MDNDELLRLRRLATDALIEYVNDERVYGLARALETACEAVGDFDSMVDKTDALEEENTELEDQIKELSDSLRGIYRASRSANSSDVKRLAEIQEICESADVDLSEIV